MGVANAHRAHRFIRRFEVFFAGRAGTFRGRPISRAALGGSMGLRFVRWWVVLMGGVLLGAGLCLHGQLAVAQHLRDEAQNTFFLWRAIGGLTFIFQDEVTQASLWMNEVPEPVMRESDRAAWTLVVMGGLMSLTAPLLHGRRGKKRRGKKSAKSG